jgi:hypothetical protein
VGGQAASAPVCLPALPFDPLGRTARPRRRITTWIANVYRAEPDGAIAIINRATAAEAPARIAV